MRFDREPWVKLYKRESPAHRLMSLEARCFRDFLLRHTDDKGLLLERSDNVPRDLCLIVAADSANAKKVVKWLKELQDVGYVEISAEGRVVLPKFEEAQQARSPGAKRQAEYEAREKAKRAAKRDDVRTDSSESVRTDAESDVRTDVTIEEMRRDEMRRDPPKPPEGDDGDDSASRLIACPKDLALPEQIIEGLMGTCGATREQVLAEVQEFKSYWTIGGGMGRTFSRGMWLRKCRERIRQRLSEANSGRPASNTARQIAPLDGPGPADPAIAERNRRALEAHERRVQAELDAEVAS